ncbi:PepSY-associated TM helix domain-containing protein [Methylobacterium sp. R2-1]|uniref:PepSY-associated TM helix domain-containing protein n=1 Tax=Methylobacterium sp. R2-1 TaxID=2587064 RepID=UPI0017AAF067|nr:PepSY-associated TM helix domain-containing protein [Methylobacterium sp. R2-1]MBB2960984.1 putative iron-regulated membrane protein [Methylobacterium sp. R2-1]
MTHPARIVAGTRTRPPPGAAAVAPVRFTASRGFRVSLWLHRWTGLIAAPFFLILCITGTILIFHEEIDEGLGYAAHAEAASPGTPERPLSEIVATAVAKTPERRPLALVFDADHPERVTVSLVEPGTRSFDGAKPVVLDRYRGTAIEAPDPRSTPTGIILTLHANWFLGLPGELAGGVVALLVVICLVTGVVIYGPFIKGLAFGLIRRGRGERLRQRDLHNFLGTVTLGWALLVSATGVTLALGDIALKVWQATELQRLAVAHGGQGHALATGPGASLDAVRAAAEAAKPGWRTSLMLYPGSAFSTDRHFTVLLVGPEGLQKRLFEIALVDAADARVAEIATLPWYLVVTQLSQPLHFGDYGGLPLKLLWTACAWFTLFVTGNGAWLWFARRPRRKAAGEERGAGQTA